MNHIKSVKFSINTVSLVVFCIILSPLDSYSKDFDDEPYLLRVATSLERASNYSSTLARQASVAYPGNASVNPASSDFRYDQKSNKNTFTSTAMNYVSESDTWLTAIAISSSFTENINGSLLVAYAYTDTIDKTNTENLDNTIRSDEYFLGYSRMINDNLSLGLQGRLVNAEINNETRVDQLAFTPGRFETDLRSFDLKFGALYSENKIWFYGISLGAGYNDTTTELSNIHQLGPIPPNTQLSSKDDNQTSYSFKAGLGYIPSDVLGLYTDLSYYSIDSKNFGIVETSKLSIGFDYKPSSRTTYRSGFTFDSNNELTLGIGLQLYLTDTIPLDIAYQYNAAPEIENEYGKFNALTFSVAFPF